MLKVESIEEKILPILKKYEVRRSSLFGSVVKGEIAEKSDIDILVELPETASLLDLVGLKMELEEELKRSVDVITYNSLHPLLRDRILSEEVSIL